MRSHAPVLIVGAGPAGIAAACAAGESGASVTVIDDNRAPGGQIWRGSMPTAWKQRLAQTQVRCWPGARAISFTDTNTLLAEIEGEAREVSFDRLIVATGARERLLPFPGWTLPGVMGVGGLQTLVKSGLPIEGKRAVIAGSGPLLAAVAAALAKAGTQVLMVAEQARWRDMLPFFASVARLGKLRQAFEIALGMRGVPYRTSSWPVAVEREGEALSVRLNVAGEQRTYLCDYFACAFGLVPNTELAQLAGCEIVDGFVQTDEFQRTSVTSIYCAGEPAGIGGVDAALEEGLIAGFHAAGREDKARQRSGARDRWRRFQRILESSFELRDDLRQMPGPDTILCRCEDVTYGQGAGSPSWREGKLQTRCGMGACQGRTCGPALEFLAGLPMQSVRPPLYPVTVATLAGVRAEE